MPISDLDLIRENKDHVRKGPLFFLKYICYLCQSYLPYYIQLCYLIPDTLNYLFSFICLFYSS